MSNYQFDTDLLALLPEWYSQILDYQEICNTEQQQFEALADFIVAVADNFFPQTMDVGSVSQWEQIFSITPSPSTETLDFRRSRILNRLSTRPPFTLYFLYQKLDELIGAGQWTVTVDYANYTLYVMSSAENQSYATEVAYTINQIKPAHIVYVNNPYTVSGLLLSEEISLAQRIYNYRLGAWGLGVNPFATEQSQGVIKTADTPSVQTALLEATANFVSSDIASALINGSISITDLTKTVTGDTLTVTYDVTEAQASTITSVALLDADGNTLTSSTVYVPVSSSTVLTHSIPVAEGVITNG